MEQTTGKVHSGWFKTPRPQPGPTKNSNFKVVRVPFWNKTKIISWFRLGR